MPTCPTCQQSHPKRDGHTPSGRQRYACRSCRRDFMGHSGSAFSGYRFPPEVILTALRWYFSYALSAQQVMELLAERGLDVSRRTILRWAQALGPLLGQAATAAPFRSAGLRSTPLACPRKSSVTTTSRTSRRSSTPGRMCGIGGAAYTGREGSQPSTVAGEP